MATTLTVRRWFFAHRVNRERTAVEYLGETAKGVLDWAATAPPRLYATPQAVQAAVAVFGPEAGAVSVAWCTALPPQGTWAQVADVYTAVAP